MKFFKHTPISLKIYFFIFMKLSVVKILKIQSPSAPTLFEGFPAIQRAQPQFPFKSVFILYQVFSDENTENSISLAWQI